MAGPVARAQGQEEDLARDRAAEEGERAKGDCTDEEHASGVSLEHHASGADVDAIRQYLVDHAQRGVRG